MTRTLVLTLLLLFSLALAVGAQPTTAAPELLSFQGRLAKPDGTPVADGSYSIRFSLWDTASGGAEKWNQTISPVLVRSGTFAVLLGNGNPITASILNGDTFLEIKVGADPALTPRQRITSVAYAIKANTVPDSAITTAKIADGAVTTPKIAADAVNNAKLLSDTASLAKVSGGRLSLNGSFLGYGRTTPVTGAEYFGIQTPNTSGFGGMYIQTQGTAGLPFYGYAAGSAANTAYHFLDGADALKWKLNNGNGLLTLTRTGLFGIGLTNPSAPLHLMGSLAPPAALLAAENGLLLGSNGTASYKWIQSYGGALTLNPQGNNVGIGNLSPVARLHVSGAETSTHGNSSAITLSNTATGGGNWYLRAGATGTGTPAGGLSLADDGFYRLVISNSGNVGIGNNNFTPLAKLDVDGNAIFRTGNIGVGTTAPGAKLDVQGGNLRIGTAGNGLLFPDGSFQTTALTSLGAGVGGVPSGYMILGCTNDSPPGYIYTGLTMASTGGNTWLTRASLPGARYEFGIATANGRIYVMGGQSAPLTTTNTNYEYDPATNTWATRAPMPTGRTGHVCATVNNRIYAISGVAYNPNPTFFSVNEEYDPLTNTWATRAPMTQARFQPAVAVVNNQIYVMGGFAGVTTDTNFRYDPASNTWVTRAPMPAARYYHAAAAVNGLIYAMGGLASPSPTAESTHYRYSPASNTWITRTNLLAANYTMAIATICEKIYLFGGAAGSNNRNDEYDPATNGWTARPNLPTAREGCGAVGLNAKAYVIGGATTAVNEEYSPNLTLFVHIKQ